MGLGYVWHCIDTVEQEFSGDTCGAHTHGLVSISLIGALASIQGRACRLCQKQFSGYLMKKEAYL